MHLTLSGNETGLVSYWQFNETSGDTAYDAVSGNNSALFNMAAENWIVSTVPAGGGTSNTQIVNTTGVIDFTGTGLLMDVTEKSGSDTIVVSRLDVAPDTLPEINDCFNSQYWIVKTFGDGNFISDLIFTVNEEITSEDKGYPKNLRLNSRSGNADGAWFELTEAFSADLSGKSVTFADITSLNQFIIGRQDFPYVIDHSPADDIENLLINSEIEISFNKDIFAGNGSIIIKRSADSTIFETIPAANTTVEKNVMTFTPSEYFSWETGYFLQIEDTAFADGIGNYFSGINDAETWNFTTISNFTDMNSDLTSVKNGSVVWGDYDKDRDLDILLTGYNGSSGNSRIYSNDGMSDDSGWIFMNIDAGIPGVNNSSAAWGDYDCDGDLDILLCGYSEDGAYCEIYRNDFPTEKTNHSFHDINAGLTGIEMGSVFWGDYDNDGDLDILLSGKADEGGVAIIYRNDRSGQNKRIFTDIDAGLTGVSNSSAAWGDYDNDGDLDILLSGYTNSSSYLAAIYRNDPGIADRIFTDIEIDLPGIDGDAAWGDYDNDGDLDILLTGFNGSTGISKIYRNDGASDVSGWIFNDIVAGLSSVYHSSAAWGDYDNDGDLDILLSGYAGSYTYLTKIYQNNDGVFTDIDTGLTGVASSSSAWGDYDNDGDLDILFSGEYFDGAYYHISKLYRNNAPLPNNTPSSPDGLVAVLTADSLTLSWIKASDNETPQDGLSYNLIIGNSKHDLLFNAPMSDLHSGNPLIPDHGNMGRLTTWLYNERLTYFSFPQVIAPDYWGVQTIDNSSGGSPFTLDSLELPFTYLQVSNDSILYLPDSLSWGVVHADSIVNFQVQIDNDSTFASCEINDTIPVSISSVSVFSLPLQNLADSDRLISDTLYYWRMKPNYSFNLPTAFTYPPANFLFAPDTSSSDTVVTNILQNDIPKTYALEQNYPNPFNPITMINYQLPMTSEVELSVYNLLGQKVVTLISEKIQAGYYQIKWDARGFASGIYIYRLRANHFNSIKKMLLLK